MAPAAAEGPIDRAFRPSESADLARRPSSQITGMENVNKKEPYIPLLINIRGKMAAASETHKRQKTIKINMAATCH
jgi:hypothetical protein